MPNTQARDKMPVSLDSETAASFPAGQAEPVGQCFSEIRIPKIRICW